MKELDIALAFCGFFGSSLYYEIKYEWKILETSS